MNPHQRVHIASDHGAFDLKQFLVKELAAAGLEVVDHGADAYDPHDDYPPFAFRVGELVVDEPGSLGIVLGLSATGMCIAANKVPGVRCAMAPDADTARFAREHLDANVVALGGRAHPLGVSLEIARTFLESPFSEDVRHERRIRMITDYESRPEG